jgi:hypothetical protein
VSQQWRRFQWPLCVYTLWTDAAGERDTALPTACLLNGTVRRSAHFFAESARSIACNSNTLKQAPRVESIYAFYLYLNQNLTDTTCTDTRTQAQRPRTRFSVLSLTHAQQTAPQTHVRTPPAWPGRADVGCHHRWSTACTHVVCALPVPPSGPVHTTRHPRVSARTCGAGGGGSGGGGGVCVRVRVRVRSTYPFY